MEVSKESILSDESKKSCVKFASMMKRNNLTTADVAKMLMTEPSVIRAKRAQLRPVTKLNLRLLELELERRKSHSGKRATAA